MLLSIIIPVYNTAQYLVRCLDSCLQQGLKVEDYEIICINDGSTDNSQEIIDKYQKQNPNITAIVQENKGQAIARNVGIDKAKGQYLFFVDSDDALLKAIEQLRAEGLYPLQHFISTDYTAYRFKLLTFILNHKIAVLIAMAILFTKGRLKHEH